MQKLTKEQGAIIGAYTGVLSGDFRDMHEYIERIMGRPMFIHELANKDTFEEIKRLSEDDFLAICAD